MYRTRTIILWATLVIVAAIVGFAKPPNVSAVTNSGWQKEQHLKGERAHHQVTPNDMMEISTREVHHPTPPVVWDGRDEEGRAVASGVYFYRMEAVERGFVETRRMLLLR